MTTRPYRWLDPKPKAARKVQAQRKKREPRARLWDVPYPMSTNEIMHDAKRRAIEFFGNGKDF